MNGIGPKMKRNRKELWRKWKREETQESAKKKLLEMKQKLTQEGEKWWNSKKIVARLDGIGKILRLNFKHQEILIKWYNTWEKWEKRVYQFSKIKAWIKRKIQKKEKKWKWKRGKWKKRVGECRKTEPNRQMCDKFTKLQHLSICTCELREFMRASLPSSWSSSPHGLAVSNGRACIRICLRY